MRPVFDLDHLAGSTDKALRHKKARRQLAIVSWRPHDHGNTEPPDPDLQGFLSGQIISLLRFGAAVQPPQLNFSDAGARQD
jgi:hypothetical protein